MGLFKSKEERRLERDIKIRQGIRRIEKSIAEQNKFSDEFVKNARQRQADRRHGVVPVHPQLAQEDRHDQKNARTAARSRSRTPC